MEDSHNGIAAVLKTAGGNPVGVRVSHPPQKKPLKMRGFFYLSDSFETAIISQCLGNNNTAVFLYVIFQNCCIKS